MEKFRTGVMLLSKFLIRIPVGEPMEMSLRFHGLRDLS